MPPVSVACVHCMAYPLSIPHRNATAQMILAMSYWRVKQKSEARASLGAGSKIIEDRFQRGLVEGNNASGFWFDWIIARMLSRECQELFAQAGHR